MPSLTMHEEGLTMGTSLSLPYVSCLLSSSLRCLGRPPGLGGRGERVSPHLSMGRATCPLLSKFQSCGVPSLQI